MYIRGATFLYLIAVIYCEKHYLKLKAKVHTTFLEKYEEYADVVLLHFQVPNDVSFAVFKFQAEEINLSIFSCKAQDISLYIKQGAPPVINPDGSQFPESFLKSSLSNTFSIDFKSDKSEHYINMSAPVPGQYYAVTFRSWTDPLQAGITQQGLTPQCFTFVDAELSVKEEQVETIIPNMDFNVKFNTSKIFKYFVPGYTDYGLLIIKSASLKTDEFLHIQIKAWNVPHVKDNISSTISKDDIPFSSKFLTQEETWYYMKFSATNTTDTDILFKVLLFSSIISGNETNNGSAVSKTYQSRLLKDVTHYEEYHLTRESSTENFLYSFSLPYHNSSTPLELNLTTSTFCALKFELKDFVDFGGTLQFILAFTPKKKDQQQQNHIVIACVNRHTVGIPTWPNKCVYGNTESTAPLILNKTVVNSTVLIPFPEAGIWFVTMKAFQQQDNKRCICPDVCQEKYDRCLKECESGCETGTYCDNCFYSCEKQIITLDECLDCTQKGCKRNNEKNISVIFDITSHPCVTGECGEHGNCMFLVSQGVVFSACSCSNNYRGWNCIDGTYANSYGMVVLALLLLVLSNLMFIPSVYFAYKRNYYVEAVVYFSIFFFSTFYHACDAGEDMISFCITKVSVLQFGDFFCALLAIWVTLIAVAHLPYFWPSLCQLSGAIFIAFGTTLDRLSLWVFLVPSVAGILIVIIRWYVTYRKYKVLGINRKYLRIYLPAGLTIVTVGLIIYTAFQTQSNYKYMHSLWHIFMAISVILILPKQNTFLPREQL